MLGERSDGLDSLIDEVAASMTNGEATPLLRASVAARIRMRPWRRIGLWAPTLAAAAAVVFFVVFGRTLSDLPRERDAARVASPARPSSDRASTLPAATTTAATTTPPSRLVPSPQAPLRLAAGDVEASGPRRASEWPPVSGLPPPITLASVGPEALTITPLDVQPIVTTTAVVDASAGPMPIDLSPLTIERIDQN